MNHVLSISMSKEQYWTLRQLAAKENKSISKLLHDKLDLDNMPLLPLPDDADVYIKPRKKRSPPVTEEIRADV